MSVIALIVAVVLFLLGLLGTVLPALPGPILVFAGMLAYGVMTDFAAFGGQFLALQAAATAGVMAVDYVAAAVGARAVGGSRRAAAGAVVGTIVALLLMGPLGLIVGPFVGALAVELGRGVGLAQAFRVGFGTVLGAIGGVALKLLMEIAMIVYFFMQIW